MGHENGGWMNDDQRESTRVITGWDETGKPFNSLPHDAATVKPDSTNYDTTDFPRKGCRQCGKRDRPQYKGQCNDDHCSHGG